MMNRSGRGNYLRRFEYTHKLFFLVEHCTVQSLLFGNAEPYCLQELAVLKCHQNAAITAVEKYQRMNDLAQVLIALCQHDQLLEYKITLLVS